MFEQAAFPLKMYISPDPHLGNQSIDTEWRLQTDVSPFSRTVFSAGCCRATPPMFGSLHNRQWRLQDHTAKSDLMPWNHLKGFRVNHGLKSASGNKALNELSNLLLARHRCFFWISGSHLMMLLPRQRPRLDRRRGSINWLKRSPCCQDVAQIAENDKSRIYIIKEKQRK